VYVTVPPQCGGADDQGGHLCDGQEGQVQTHEGDSRATQQI